MKKPKANLRTTLLNAALLTAVTQVPALHAANLYWDTNGATAGSGNASGSWDAASNWTTDAAGTTAPVAWSDGETAVFSAGTDGANFTATITGTVATPSIIIEEAGNTVTLAGGTLAMGGGSINSSALGVTTNRNVTISSVIAGAGGLTVAANGDLSATGGGSNSDLTLSGINTFTGDLTVTAGLVTWTTEDSFGNAANKIVLNGGGLLTTVAAATLNRDIVIGPAGGTLRTYGSTTLTLNGVISGSTTINRTDGGNIILNADPTFSGTLNIQRGIVTMGNGGSTGKLAAVSAINLGDAAGAGTLRSRLDGSSNLVAITNNAPISFLNPSSAIEQFGDAADELVINTTFGADTVNGILRSRGGDVTLASGANVKVRNLAVTSDPANSPAAVLGNIKIGTGAQFAARFFNIGDGNATAGTVAQTGGTVTIESGAEGFRLGHWNNGVTPGSIYNLSGGTLDGTGASANAGDAQLISVGWDGQGTMTVGGGSGSATLKAVGIMVDRNRAGTGNFASTLTVSPNGLVEIGSRGTIGQVGNDAIVLNGGNLKATADSTWAAPMVASAPTSLDIDGFNPTLGGTITGTAAINVTDTFGDGSLGLGGGTGTTTISAALAGSVPIFKTGTGTVNLTGTSPQTGLITVAAGTLQVSGSVAGKVNAEDLGTLSGEGTIGGDLKLGDLNGTTLRIDPATAGMLTTNGTLTLTGTTRVAFSSPITTVDPVIGVIDYGTLAGSVATGLSLYSPGSYRSATFSDDIPNTRINLTLDTKNLVWEGTGGLWDVGSSSNWSDGAASSFYWGDLITFDDSSAVSNVGIFGELQPGRMIVDSDNTNYSFTNAGTAQVETANAAGPATADGNVVVTVTSAGMAGSPLALPVAVLNGDTDVVWAGKVRDALAANATITERFTIGGAGTAIILTRKADLTTGFLPNDATLNIDLANGTPNPGITPAAVSADTTAGYPTSFIAGGGSLLKKGSSILTMNAPNTFAGGTVISEGTIDIRQAGALGTGTVTLGDAATGTSNVALYLDSARVNFGRPVIVSNNGTGTATLGSRATVTGTGDNNQFTNIVLERDVVFDSNGNDRTDFENITGTGNIRVIGAGRSIFPTSPANWVGNVTVATSGALASLQIGVASTAGNRIPDASNLTIEASGLVRLSATGETIAGLFGEGTVNTNSPSGGTGTLTVGFGGANGDFSGLLTGNVASNILAFAKTGAGTQIISGNSSYSGATTVSGGVLQVGAGGASGDLGTGAVSIAAGTTLTYNRTGAVTQEGALNSAAAGAGVLNVNGDATTAVTLNAGGNFSGVVNINQGSLVFAATNPTGTAASAPVMNIAAGAALTNAGTSNHAHIGTLNLTGGATVTTGGGTGSYNGENYQLNGNVTVAGGSAAAQITREASRTNANSGLALGILNGAKVFTVADVTASAAPDLVISTELENPDNGAGALTKSGPGTMQLAGAIAHSYTGATTVTEGVLLASGSIAGPLAVDSTGTLAPGASAGPFAAGATTLAGTYACEIDGANSDLLAVTGDLTLGAGSTLAITTLGGGATQATYVVATYTGVRNGSFATVSGLPAGYSVVYNDTAKQVEVTSASANGYGDWETANGIAGAGSNTDSDGDGIPNGIEFVIGGDPSGPGSASNSLLEPVAVDATYLTYVFRRSDASAAYDPYVEYGSNLTGWTEATAGEPVLNPVLVSEDNNFYGDGIDRVTVRIPRALATGTRLFARLRVDIP
jgi:autotransporter-associated beta strand protein